MTTTLFFYFKPLNINIDNIMETLITVLNVVGSALLAGSIFAIIAFSLAAITFYYLTYKYQKEHQNDLNLEDYDTL